MESEEQKPSELLLNSEVKSEKIGTNPLLDDEYFRMNIPKLEEIDNYSMNREQQLLENSEKVDNSLEKEIKMEELEEIDDTDYFIDSEQNPESLEDYERFEYFEFPTRNIHSEGFVVPKLEQIDESSSSLHCEQSIGKIDNSLGKEIKSEGPEDQEIKEEPLEDKEYSQSMPMRLPILPSSPPPIPVKLLLSNRVPTYRFDMFTPKIHRHNNLKPTENRREIYKKKCDLCSEFQEISRLKPVRLKNEKLLMAVGRVLSGDLSVAQGKEFHATTYSVFICDVHYKETIDSIYKLLNIKEPHEIATCTVHRVNELMLTVNSITQWIPSNNFIYSFKSFVTRNNRQSMQHPPRVPPTRLPRIHTFECSICHKRSLRLVIQKFTSGTEKLILIFGRVITNKLSLNEARRLINRYINVLICSIHLTEIVDDILNHFKIDNFKQLLDNPTHLRRSLSVVRSFLPDITDEYFIRTVNWFMVNVQNKHMSNEILLSSAPNLPNHLSIE